MRAASVARQALAAGIKAKVRRAHQWPGGLGHRVRVS